MTDRRAYLSAYRAANREQLLERQRAYGKARYAAGHRVVVDPVKLRARRAIDRNVRRGKLAKPTACPECGRTDRPIQAHHDDYSKPLDIAWLCSVCHGARHRPRELV